MANGKVNTKIKDMNIECTDLKRRKLYDFLDKRLVLYFYPKDMTPGCTTESIEFNESLSKIKKLKTNVVGVYILFIYEDGICINSNALFFMYCW